MKPFRGKRKRPERTHGEIHALPRAGPRRGETASRTRSGESRGAAARRPLDPRGEQHRPRRTALLPESERRDPSGDGLRPRRKSGRRRGESRAGRPGPGTRPGLNARRYRTQAQRRPYGASAPGASGDGHRAGGPSVRRPDRPAVGGRASRTGGRTRRSATLQLRALVRPVLKHGPRSLTCARVVGTLLNPKAQ